MKKKIKKRITKKVKPKSTKSKVNTANQLMPRHKEKYPALNPKRAVRNRKELLEDVHEYVHLLNDSEKDWLNRFLEETVITNFQHKGKQFYKKQEDKRALWRDNNSRNKCIYTNSKTKGDLTFIYNNNYLDSINEMDDAVNTEEDNMIGLLDLKKKFERTG